MKKVSLCFLICWPFFAVTSMAQQLKTAIHIGGKTNEFGFAVTTDDEGNIYAAGNFSDTVDFDPGPGVKMLGAYGFEDAYVAKFDRDGKLLWAFNFGGLNYNKGNAITLDPDGNVIVGGYFQGVADFDPGAGVFSLSSKGLYDAFLAKYTSDGQFLWAFNIGSSREDIGYTVAAGPGGDLYLAGHFQNIIDFDPGTGQTFFTAKGLYDIFVAKYSPTGRFQWVATFGGPGPDFGFTVNTDAAGFVYLAGCFEGKIDFDPGPGSDTLRAVSGADAFVVKLDSNGSHEWAFSFGSNGSDIGYAVLPNNHGKFYLAGSIDHSADFDPGPDSTRLNSIGFSDAFLAKYGDDGSFDWAVTAGGRSAEGSFSLAKNTEERLFLPGFFRLTADFAPGAAVDTLTSNGLADAFVAQYDSTGRYLGAFQVGGAGMEAFYGITVDKFGDFVVAGSFRDTIDCDPEEGENILQAIGEDDIMILKYTPTTTPVRSVVPSFDFSFFPNPTSGLLHVEMPDFAEGIILLSDAFGRTIFQKRFSRKMETLDLSNLPAGAYFLTVRSEKGMVCKKVIRNKE